MMDAIPQTDEEIQTYLNSITSKEKISIKPKFAKRYRQLTDYPLFMYTSLQYLRRAIRVNTLKISVDDLKQRLEKDFTLSPVPWCKEGFWITHKQGRRDMGNTTEHALGYIYIQEPASMLPPIVLDPKPGDTVLDTCAAPGSKTTQIAMYMQNEGVLVANDYKYSRIKPLGLNMQRVGITNAIISLAEGHRLRGMEFDKILVDAPCTGTGTIRKSLRTLKIWNPHVVKRINAQQKQLLNSAFSMLKSGGTLVYSTCTLEPEENEGTITHLLKERSDAYLDDIDLPIKRSPAITEFDGEQYHPDVKKCLRIWPQDNDTEGFFVAKLKKK